MDFTGYLENKKIDPIRFKTEEPEVFKSYENIFSQTHPDSFTAQKLFMINKLRRKYVLPGAPIITVTTNPERAKPKIKMRPKKSDA